MKRPVFNTKFLHNVLVVRELTRFPEEEYGYGLRNAEFTYHSTT